MIANAQRPTATQRENCTLAPLVPTTITQQQRNARQDVVPTATEPRSLTDLAVTSAASPSLSLSSSFFSPFCSGWEMMSSVKELKYDLMNCGDGISGSRFWGKTTKIYSKNNSLCDGLLSLYYFLRTPPFFDWPSPQHVIGYRPALPSRRLAGVAAYLVLVLGLLFAQGLEHLVGQQHALLVLEGLQDAHSCHVWTKRRKKKQKDTIIPHIMSRGYNQSIPGRFQRISSLGSISIILSRVDFAPSAPVAILWVVGP